MASSTNTLASAALTTKQKKDLINRFERESMYKCITNQAKQIWNTNFFIISNFTIVLILFCLFVCCLFSNIESRREEKLRASSKLLAKEVEARINSRLNKVLRKLWDVKIKDVISIERETQNLEVMKLLYHINKMKKKSGK